MKKTLKDFIDSYIKEKIIKNNKNYEYLDILRLIAHYFNKDKNEILIYLDNLLSKKQEKELTKLFDKLYIEDTPLQYIIGKQLFYNEEYIVNKNVLIPRADSEILVETAIKYIEENKYNNLLDMCTGSGCIGISVCNNSSILNTTLVDISNEALEIAKKNIELNNVKKDIQVINSNLFENLDKNIKYDIIVSNPPYIKTDVIKTLSNEVKKEPILALDGGSTGMDIYTRIFKEAYLYLNNNGMLILEIGYDQLEDIKTLLKRKENSIYKFKECIKDLAGNDRVVVLSIGG